MKKILVLGLSSILAVPLLAATFVYANEETSTVKPTNQVAHTTEDGSETPTPDLDEKTLQEHIQKRKAVLKTKLAAAEKLKIQNKCQASQGKVSSVHGRIKGLETSHGKVYNNITTHLEELSEKLKNKGADTAELDADITELKAKIETFKADLIAYKDSVEVIKGIDCKQFPELFKETLEDARADLKKVQEDALAIKAYVKDTIKPLLKTIKASLEASKPEGEE